MASVITDNGRQRISFRGLDGKRRSLRVGAIPKAEAATIAGHVQAMLNAAQCNVLVDRCDAATVAKLGQPLRDAALSAAAWLDAVPDDLWAKLAKVHLVSPRETAEQPSVPLLGPFLDAFRERRNDLKRSTLVVYGQAIRNLLEFFGRERRLESITPGEADDFRRWLQTSEKLSSATIGRRCDLARTFFEDARKRRLIAENPFSGMKRGNCTNPKRQRFIPVEIIRKVIDACPNAEWRALVALSRFGGLRVPSEAMMLRWEDMNLAEGFMVIRSPKTERYEGRAQRICPIFPELRPYLEELEAAAPDGQIWVLQRIRPPAAVDRDWQSANLRTRFEKIILKAGLKPWPKLWHNLRASRQTELTNHHPAHVVAAWLGNTVRVAEKHYLQVTEDHFRRAVTEWTTPRRQTESDARSDARDPPHNSAHACTILQKTLRIKGQAKTNGAGMKRN